EKWTEATQDKTDKPKGGKKQKKEFVSASLLDVVGYYMGGKTMDDGRFEASFLIEWEGEEKENWPGITFTGDQYRELCEGLDKHQRVALSLADNAVKPASGNGKGKPTKMPKGKGGKKDGSTNFYAIVIGKLKSKDIEIGEFTMEVDHVTSMYGNRWVKDEILGKKVTVTGVSGEFRDNLLLIKRGETLKFRSGGYVADSSTLTFAPKFHVLERAKPFKAEDYGVPPDAFRGFAGELQGKVVELGGFEITLQVAEVVKTAEGSKAEDPSSIKGKLVRIAGFYDQHAEKFEELHADDLIRVGVRHRNPKHDEFTAAKVLEKVVE
ncbi:hypothetical protein N8586_05890, partial [Verrucomicrobiales bacterium]|nr:hypothetical protein [Verrucomicrobiales bacterium]